jgi:hypothetical protein
MGFQKHSKGQARDRIGKVKAREVIARKHGAGSKEQRARRQRLE